MPMAFEDRATHRTGGHSSRRLTRACPFEDVTSVAEPELQDPGQVGMARANPCDGIGLEPARLDLHGTFPVLPVAVLDNECHGRSEGLAASHAADDPRCVLLDLLALAAPVTSLAAAQVGIDIARGIKRQTGRHAFDDHGQLRPVGLAGCQKSKHLQRDCIGERDSVRVVSLWRRDTER